jgi:hypothetical protein
MTPEIQTMLSVGIPTLAVLIGILVNNSRFNDINFRLNDMNGRFGAIDSRFTDMRAHFDNRIDDLKETWRSELRRVEEVLDARLTHLEERLR